MALQSAPFTFLFTDIEGSTRLWERQTEQMREDLARHDQLLRRAIELHHGRIVKGAGDGCCAVFSTPQDAVEAAAAAQRALRKELPEIRVRMAIHTGEAEERDGDYFGPALNRVARLLSAGHGGQVLLSRASADAIRPTLPPEVLLQPLGTHQLRDIIETETIYQVAPPDLPRRFPPLNTVTLARRQGALRASSFASLVLAAVTSLAVMVYLQKERLRRGFYISQINWAQQFVDEGKLASAAGILRQLRPGWGESNLRGWEWYYLSAQCRDQSLRTLRVSDSQVNFALPSHDGRRLFTATQGAPLLQVWDAASLRELDRVSIGTTTLWYAALSPDDRLIALSDVTSTRVIDLGQKKELARFPGVLPHFLPDGRTLVTRTESGIRTWDLLTRSSLAELPSPAGNAEAQFALGISPDGSLAAVGDATGQIRLWNLRSRQPAGVLRGHRRGVFTLVFSPDGRLLGSGSPDNTAKLWDVASLKERCTLSHGGIVTSIAFSPAGQVATSCSDNFLRVWDTASGRLLSAIPDNQHGAMAGAYLRDGGTLATAGTDGTVKFWNTTRAAAHEPTLPWPAEIQSVAFLPDNRLIGAADAGLVLWSPGKNEPHLLKNPGSGQLSTAVSLQGRIVATGDGKGMVSVWDIRTQRLLAKWPAARGSGGPPAVVSLALSPDARALAVTVPVTTRDGELRIWDVASRREISRRRGPNMLALSRNGRTLVTAGGRTLSLWRWNAPAREFSLTASRPLPLHQVCIALSPDGRTIALGGNDGTVEFWSAPELRRIAAREGHSTTATSVAFSPDGRTLASTGYDGLVKLWSVELHDQVGILRGAPGGPWPSVAFSPDGRSLAAAGQAPIENGQNPQERGFIRLWSAPFERDATSGSQPLSGLLGTH